MIVDIYNPAFWEQQWREVEEGDTKTISKGYATAEFWDSVSGTYDERFDQAAQEKLDFLAGRLEREGYLRDGSNVLEIGCGTGRLAITLARHGAQVTATDISSGMLDRLSNNLPPDLNGSITTEQIDWHAHDIAYKGWENAFDLVIANMTPALNTPESLDRMIRASRYGCYLKTWAEKTTSPVFRSIWRAIAGRDLNDRHAPIVHILNLLLARGFHPSLSFDEIQFTRTSTVEETITSNVTYFSAIFGSSNTFISDIVSEESNRLAVDGMITETIRGMTGTLLWTV